MTFDPFKLIKYHLYLLQLENYELGRFWKLLLKRGWFGAALEQRKNLVWTKKALVLFVLAEVLILFFAVLFLLKGFYMPFAFWWQKAFTFLVAVYILDFFTPIFLSLANLILWPFDFTAKKVLTSQAKRKIKSLPDLKIIGVAGSYGKTTMKEVLKEVLGFRFKVLATPESINTPVGIARWILNKVDAPSEVLIVEMGEHYRGDVQELCSITKPDFAVVTGINESHLERMKTLDIVIATIFEIVSKSKPGATIILNGDDANVMGHYKEFVWPDHKLEFFSKNSSSDKSQVTSEKFNTEKLVWEAEFEGVGKVDINLLGEYALADVDAAVKIAQVLGMNAEEIKKGIANIKPIEHRLQPVRGSGEVLVIDDAYNGNPAGVKEAIKVLSRFEGRRKIYITPGLVEMGKASDDVHRTIGKQLGSVADLVILIKNSVTPFIEQGIRNHELGVRNNAPDVIWFDSAQEAHASLGKILKPGDVVLFQNDWGDNYI